MNKLTIAMALGLAAATATAEDSSRGTLEGVCESVHTLTGNIMKARQSGVPMPDLIKAARDSEVEDVTRAIIMDAYDRPRFRGDEYQERSIQEFQNEWYRACLEELDQYREDN